MFEVPHIIGLQERVEQYLYSVKSVLRDLAKLFEPFFGQQFSEARYDKVLRWCVLKFGEYDDLSKLIKGDHDLWINKLVRMRNAVEHPGVHSGYLYVHNFEVALPESGGQPQLIEPTWHADN